MIYPSLLFLAPDKTPVNATARATSATTIHVTWSPVSLQDEPFLQGYRIKYYRVDQPDLVSNLAAGKNDIQTLLIGLKPFTTYAVRVAAFATEDGNFTDPLYVKTWEWGKRKRFKILLCMSVIYGYHISSNGGTICPSVGLEVARYNDFMFLGRFKQEYRFFFASSDPFTAKGGQSQNLNVIS